MKPLDYDTLETKPDLLSRRQKTYKDAFTQYEKEFLWENSADNEIQQT